MVAEKCLIVQSFQRFRIDRSALIAASVALIDKGQVSLVIKHPLSCADIFIELFKCVYGTNIKLRNIAHFTGQCRIIIIMLIRQLPAAVPFQAQINIGACDQLHCTDKILNVNNSIEI